MIKADQYISSKELFKWDTQLQLGLRRGHVAKGDLFLKEGQRCDYFYYLLEGFVRIYYHDLNANQITHWFSQANSMITSPLSFLKGEKNILYFEALEPTELLMITASQIKNITTAIPSAGEAFRRLNAEFAIALSRRVMSIHTQTTEERYLQLIDEHPYLFQKANLGHIASFLGITPQSLSRVRKKL